LIEREAAAAAERRELVVAMRRSRGTILSNSGGGVGAPRSSDAALIEWNIALPFATGSVAALLVGRRIAARVAGVRLQQAFAVTSCAVSLLMLFKGLGWFAS
jgi:uncharacterized membrane protein YfcA